MSVTSASASEVESERDYLARTAAASLIRHEAYLGGASPAAPAHPARFHPNPPRQTATPPRYGAAAPRGPSPMFDSSLHSPPAHPAGAGAAAYYQSQQQQQRHVHFGQQQHPQQHQQQSRVPIIVSDDIVSGSKRDGWMSPVRRFFVLFVLFDVILTALLWAITVIVTGRDVAAAVRQQIFEYTIHDSMFDCVVSG